MPPHYQMPFNSFFFLPYGVFSAAGDCEESLTHFASRHVFTSLLSAFKYYVEVRVSRFADWRDYAAGVSPLQGAQNKRFPERRHHPRANSRQSFSDRLLADRSS